MLQQPQQHVPSWPDLQDYEWKVLDEDPQVPLGFPPDPIWTESNWEQGFPSLQFFQVGGARSADGSECAVMSFCSPGVQLLLVSSLQPLVYTVCMALQVQASCGSSCKHAFRVLRRALLRPGKVLIWQPVAERERSV